MNNVYRAPVEVPVPQVELKPGDERAPANSTLELAAANAGVALGTGYNYVNKYGKRLNRREIDAKLQRGDDDVPQFWRQPFWFVHELNERIVVYVAGEMHRAYNNSGKLQVSFNSRVPRGQLRNLLISWHAARNFTSLVRFGGARNFEIKSSRQS